MNKIKALCRETFNKAQKSRQAYPLPSGRYKLKEALWRMNENLSSLHEIMAAKCAERAGQHKGVRPRVPDGAAGFLKTLPEVIARDLGYDIIPAVEALAGDGVPAAQVKTLANHARIKAADIVRRCDAVHDRLRGGVGIEYAHMMHRDSLLAPLLQDAVALIDEMLWASEPARPIPINTTAGGAGYGRVP